MSKAKTAAAATDILDCRTLEMIEKQHGIPRGEARRVVAEKGIPPRLVIDGLTVYFDCDTVLRACGITTGPRFDGLVRTDQGLAALVAPEQVAERVRRVEEMDAERRRAEELARRPEPVVKVKKRLCSGCRRDYDTQPSLRNCPDCGADIKVFEFTRPAARADLGAMANA